MAENVFGVTQGGIDAPVTVDEVDLIVLQEERVARPPQEGRPRVKMLSCGRPIPRNASESGGRLTGRNYPNGRWVNWLYIPTACCWAITTAQDATASVFVGDWYLTGDLGYMADGEVYVTGRKKDLIIVGGRNVFPQDLEALASQVPGVHPGRVAAFGVLNESARHRRSSPGGGSGPDRRAAAG
jgi:fatty-acyl-CoA synthase